jgi:hypothetical protein
MSAIQSRRAVSVRDRIAIGESIKNAQNIVRKEQEKTLATL